MPQGHEQWRNWSYEPSRGQSRRNCQCNIFSQIVVPLNQASVLKSFLYSMYVCAIYIGNPGPGGVLTKSKLFGRLPSIRDGWTVGEATVCHRQRLTSPIVDLSSSIIRNSESVCWAVGRLRMFAILPLATLLAI